MTLRYSVHSRGTLAVLEKFLHRKSGIFTDFAQQHGAYVASGVEWHCRSFAIGMAVKTVCPLARATFKSE